MQYILLVEDDEDLADGIALALEGEDLSFTRCRSAKEAREALEKQNYDLLLFDISLPDGSGSHGERRYLLYIRRQRPQSVCQRPLYGTAFCGTCDRTGLCGL